MSRFLAGVVATLVLIAVGGFVAVWFGYMPARADSPPGALEKWAAHHSLNATIFAQAGHGIPCLGTTHADHFYGEIPVTRPMKPEEVQEDYEWNTANVIIERFEGLDVETMPAVLVNSHGPFTWGDSGVKAIEAALALELVAEMALKSLLLNPVASPIPDFLLNKHYLRKHGENAYYGQPDPSQISP